MISMLSLQENFNTMIRITRKSDVFCTHTQKLVFYLYSFFFLNFGVREDNSTTDDGVWKKDQTLLNLGVFMFPIVLFMTTHASPKKETVESI